MARKYPSAHRVHRRAPLTSVARTAASDEGSSSGGDIPFKQKEPKDNGANGDVEEDDEEEEEEGEE